MEYSNAFYPQHETAMHGLTPTHPASHPMLRQGSYSNGSGMPSGIHGPVYPASPQDEAEELDTSSRPRLTQEQIAILEKHFKGKNKPNTDFKRQLAKQIGLSLQRVNVGTRHAAGCSSTDKSCRIGIKIAAPRPDTRADRNKASMLSLPSSLPTGHRRTCLFLISSMAQCTGLRIAVLFLKNLRRVISYQVPDPMSLLKSRQSQIRVLTPFNL